MRCGRRTFPSWTATAEGHSLLIRWLYISHLLSVGWAWLRRRELPTLTVVFVEAASKAFQLAGS